MNRLTRRALTTAALVAGSTLGTIAPAHAAVPSCSEPVVVATQVTPHPVGLRYNFIDVASATAACVDLTLAPHTAVLVFEWEYFTSAFTWSAMPACPTTQESVATPTPGAIAVQGAATCNRVPESDAFEVPRRVCVDLVVDGASYFPSETCVVVLLNPTPL